MYGSRLRRGLAAALSITLTAAGLLGAAVAISPAPPAQAAENYPPGGGMLGYRIFDLSGGAPGMQFMETMDLSDDGVVVGNWANPDNSIDPFYWKPGTGLQLLDDDGSVNAWAEAITPDGSGIYGYNFEYGAPQEIGHGYVTKWSWNAEEEYYGGLERVIGFDHDGYGVGSNGGSPVAANNAGQVVLSNAEVLAGGGVSRLTPPPYTLAQRPSWGVSDINAGGSVSGLVSHDPDGQDGEAYTIQRAATWPGPSEFPDPPGSGWTSGQAINDSGDVVVHGINNTAWLREGNGWVEMGAFMPTDINNDDQVVGYGADGAVLWNVDQGLTNLNDLVMDDAGWDLRQATKINEQGQIAGIGFKDGRQVSFLLDPIVPVVFVPGAAASILEVGNDPYAPAGTEIWLGCGQPLSALSLDPADHAPRNVDPVDAARFMTCGPLDGRYVSSLNAYGTLLNGLKTLGGFVEYDVDRQVERRTTAGCDLSQQDNHPNLFVFAYDWRRDNAIAAEQLEDYIGCIRKFHPSGDINIVTHSMGSIVARRYVLDNPDAEVGRMITIGAPWLGAPKLVNTLQTGEFAPPIASGPIIARMAQRFTATHQLMSAELYHQATGQSVLIEDGWDIDHDEDPYEEYSYAEMAAYLNGQSPVSDPATNATNFQGYSTPRGGQADWTNDATDVEYFHVVGLQMQNNTIGQVVATNTPVCFLSTGLFCEAEEHFEVRRAWGDGTVPLISATRQGVNGFNLNAPGATILTVASESVDGDYYAEHTGLASNPKVISTIIGLLHGGELAADQPQEAGIAASSASAAAAPSGAPVYTDLLVGADAALDAAAAADTTPVRTVTLIDADDVQIADNAGHSSRPPAGVPDHIHLPVPGVGESSLGEHARLLTLPGTTEREYTITFAATDRPARIELAFGTTSQTQRATRWVDVELPDGAAAELVVGATGFHELLADLDGDGEPDTAIEPDITLSGADAADTDAPDVSIAATAAGTYAVIASDAGTGVARTLWSTDGARFEPYDEPLELDPATTPTLWAFAEDHAGNRSALVAFDLADAPVVPFTTATVTPAANDQGWSRGAVTVDLEAVAGDDGDVDHITYTATGADPIATTTVAGDNASIEVDAVGRTTITFTATSAGGTTEPLRSVTVGVDGAAPTVEMLQPVEGTVVPALTRIAGIVDDDAAGTDSVRVRLTNGAGQTWTGAAWTAGDHWLDAGDQRTWQVTAALPTGDDLPDGSYRLTIEATDRAGRVTRRGPVALTVWPDAGHRIYELAPPAGSTSPTGAVAIDDRGVVTGYWNGASHHGAPMRWEGGLPEPLPIPAGVDGAFPEAAASDGTFVGRASTQSQPTAAVVWPTDGQPALLPTLAAGDTAWAHGVNAEGTIVGRSGNVPVRWDDRVVTPLPGLDAGDSGIANAVSDTGLIVGETTTDAGRRAIVWRDGVTQSLGTLGGSQSWATDVNEAGQVVGTSLNSNGVATAFLYSNGKMTPVDGLFADSSSALAVNDSGMLVGSYVRRRDGERSAFLWSVRTGGIDLNELAGNPEGWELIEARDINEFGQIIGFGTYHGVGRGFLLSTVHAPMASDAATETAPAAPVEFDLPVWDPDPLDTVGAEIVTQPAHGAVTVQGSRATYTPAGGFTGTDTFTFRATDGMLTSTVATATVTVDSDVPPPTTTPPTTVPPTTPPTTVPPTTTPTTPPTTTPPTTTPTTPPTTTPATSTPPPTSTAPTTVPPTTTPPAVPAIVPVDPARYWDTRREPTFDGAFQATGRLDAKQVYAVQIAGRGDVPSDATGVVANLTVIGPDGAGHATLFPCGEQPTASNLNYVSGAVLAGNAVVALDDHGQVCTYTHAGGDYALDVNGYVPHGSPVVMLTPARYLDTRQEGRSTTFDGAHQGAGQAAAGSVVEVPIAGRGDIPSGARTAFVTVTAVAPDADGYLTVFPCGDRPHASTVNYASGQTVPNGAVAELSSTGSLCVYTKAAAHIVVDVADYLPEGGRGLGTTAPERLLDTRPGGPTVDGANSGTPGRLAAGEAIEIQVAGRGSIPAGASAALLNVGLVGPDAAGYATLFPCGERPQASNVNVAGPGAVRANNALTKLSADGTVCLFVKAGTDLILDATGWVD